MNWHKKILLLACWMFIAVSIWGQDLSNFRQKTFSNNLDTIFLDSLTVIPNSLIIRDSNNALVPDSLFEFDINTGMLMIRSSYRFDSFNVSYRVYPMAFGSQQVGRLYGVHHKKDSLIKMPNPYISRLYNNPYADLSAEKLNRSGYISRGINFGNNQDVVVNSALNMQLSGQLSENLKVEAAITDNNIPIQPNGNTQQIQEFDQVYISIYNNKTRLRFGDFELNRKQDYFLKINKKLMGAFVKHQFTSKKVPSRKLTVDVAGAVAKGKYNKMDLTAQEGVQGPYLLRGANNENYIIVLAGTEKVYIDGELLKRGENNDYTINYNLAELTFTTRRMITQESRIVVEFEYTDKNYAKFTVGSRLSLETKNSNFWLQFLSDHDSKNQPVNADYSEAERLALKNAGDDPFKAISYSFDSLGFSPNEIRYQMIDSLGYDSVFVYSINPNNAFYRVKFAFVGEGNGDYLPKVSSANGRVFEWVAPKNGISQGSYLPIKLLVMPQSQQMVTTGGRLRLKSYTQVDYELALSHFDANTFSKRDAEDDLAWAYKIGLLQDLMLKDTSKQSLKLGFWFENIENGFKPFEQFRTLEFNRDWNINSSKIQQSRSYEGSLTWEKTSLGQVQYRFKMLNLNRDYNGLKHLLSGDARLKRLSVKAEGSWLKTDSKDGTSDFLRSFSKIKYHITDLWSVGILERSENNLKHDSLGVFTNNSYAFFQWEAFNKWASEKGNALELSYSDRLDNGAKNGGLGKASRAQSVQTNLNVQSLKNQSLKANFTWRRVHILDSAISKAEQNEQTYIGKLEHALRLYKNAISVRTMYEVSSGLELKKEFAYIEVPDGQGVYQWIDYNNDGAQDLDEFEKAVHQDQAKYIRVNIPSKVYEKAYSNQFTETVHFYPYKIWRNKNGILKFISRFSNLLNYKVKKKVRGKQYGQVLNPFYKNIADSSLLSMNQSIRNTFSFNKTNTIYGLDFIYLKNQNKSLLSNGFDRRSNESYALNFRLNISRKISLNNQLGNVKKQYFSEFFPKNNYRIQQWENLLELNHSFNNYLRLTLSYQFKDKRNTMAFQKSKMHKVGFEFKYNIAGKTNIQTNIEYFFFKYNDAVNNSIAFEMLEGLLPGNNGQWSILFQTQLSKYLQLNLSYLGRVAEDGNVVHNAQAQLRAFF